MKISICDALSQFNEWRRMQSEYDTPKLKELEQLKLLPSVKSATADKYITKKHKKQCYIEITVTK